MKRMERGAALLAALLLVLSLTACGGSSGGDNGGDSKSGSTAPQAAPMEPMADYAAADDAPMAPEGEVGWAEETEGGAGVNPVLADAKIIYTADMELETREYDQTVGALDRLVAEVGGYYESRSAYNYGGYRSADMTVRVPAERYQDFCGRTGELAHRTRMNEDTQNVSEAYYDVEARLTTQRTKLARLQELLSQAENMEDIIALESALSETELQIEYLTGELRSYDALISFSTVTLHLQEVYRLSNEEEVPMTFSQRLGSAFSTGLRRGMDTAENLVIFFASNWVVLLAWAAVIAAAAAVLRRRKGRLPGQRRKKKDKDAERTEDQNP